MKKIITLFAILLTTIQLFAQLSWQSRQFLPGSPRHHAIGFSHGINGYVLTGQDTAQLKDFWEYNAITNTWAQLPDYPGLKSSYGIGAVVGDTAYVGFGYSDTLFLTDWWAYNFITSTWTQKASFPSDGRNHPTATAVNGKIYMGFGDNANGSINDWWEYNPANDTWSAKALYPGLKMHHPVSCAHNGLIYLSEGHWIDTASNYGSKKFYSYNSMTDTWDTLADMPGPGVVAGASFCLGTNKIYAGIGIEEPVEVFHHEFYEYDIITGVWDTIAEYPGQGVFGSVSFNIGNIGYVATGYGGGSTRQEFFMLAPMLPIDGGISKMDTINHGPSCLNTFVPMVTLKNYGTDTLTTCTISYQIDANPIQTYNWTGSIGSLDTSFIVLPSQTATPGVHTFYCKSVNPNGITDLNTYNDNASQEFLILSAATKNTPIFQGFDSTSIFDNGWNRYNEDGELTWERTTLAGGFAASASSVWMDFYDEGNVGSMDYLYSPALNFTQAVAPSFMTFALAYAPYDTVNYCDQLDIEVSDDCGATWTNVYSKDCVALMTDSVTTDLFVPDSTGSQWRKDSVSLNAFAGKSSIIIRFRGTSAYGNSLFLDDINIMAAISNGINEIDKISSFEIYPNPTDDVLKFSKPLKNIVVLNVLGELLIRKAGITQSLSTKDFKNGVYFLKANEGIQKFIVKH